MCDERGSEKVKAAKEGAYTPPYERLTIQIDLVMIKSPYSLLLLKAIVPCPST